MSARKYRVIVMAAICAANVPAGARDDWTMPAGDHANSRFSDLAEITTGNIATLKRIQSFALHMLQHELLMLAAPLLVLGRGLPTMLCFLPHDARRSGVGADGEAAEGRAAIASHDSVNSRIHARR